MPVTDFDIKCMKRALQLAKKGYFTVSPNPMVGAVIVSGGQIVAEGYHHHPGSPHAEIVALKNFQFTNLPSTMYINLEPCCHFGKTGPCVDEIINSPIKKIFISTKDPNPLVFGKGIEKLKEAGIEVFLGLLEKEAIFLNRTFFYNNLYDLPYVILKWASTLDGYIADFKNFSKWITEENTRKIGKLLREEVDAILLGSNTILRDNPKLKRLREHPPRKPLKKIILDPEGKIPEDYNVFESGEVILVLKEGINKKIKENVKILNMPLINGSFPLKELLRKLKKMEIYSILVEGGGKTASSFLKEGLIQEVAFFYSPKLLGGGIKTFSEVNLPLEEAIKIEPFSFKKIGEDIYIRGLLCSLELFKV